MIVDLIYNIIQPLIYTPTASIPISNWILATGYWDDDGEWDDDGVWND